MNSFMCDGEITNVSCVQCKEAFVLPVTQQQIEAWQRGALIQKAMPNLLKDERELFISGLCGKCFDATFADDEEEHQFAFKEEVNL
jgi:hypothetical protein